MFQIFADTSNVNLQCLNENHAVEGQVAFKHILLGQPLRIVLHVFIDKKNLQNYVKAKATVSLLSLPA